MSLRIPELPSDWHISVGTYVAGFIAVVTLISFLKQSAGPNLGKIPTAGSSTWLGSWWDGIQFLIDATDIMQEGYEKYKGTPFKISGFFRWMVVLTGRQHVEEFCRRRDDELSFVAALEDVLKAEHTFGRDTHRIPYHISVLRSKLNRNLGALYDDMRDEIVTAFDDLLNLEGHDWKGVPALHTMEVVVSRISNRIFVGLPLCRNSDWVNLNINFTLDVFKMAALISLFPSFIAPLAGWVIINTFGPFRRAAKHLAPVIEARRKHLADGSDQPNDSLSWLLEGSEASRRTVPDLTRRILALNFAAIHQTSQIFTQALYSLAANPQYAPILREEVESIVKEEGWSKSALSKMHKVDSFMREILRMYGVTLTNVMRKAVKDVTLYDGTVIPKGTFVVLATQSMHLDDEFYDDAETFDPFRFAKMRSGESSDNLKHQLAATNPEYMPFGHGRHACPGRFFAASELTTMLAHVVVTYDIKLEDTVRPPNLRICAAIAPHPTARVMFRRRT